jgi:ubiquinone/menaquinone biosynthesis C-methylase UbiE
MGSEALLRTEPDLAFRWRARTALRYLQPESHDRILDCGCGFGFYLMALGRVGGCRSHGLDHDWSALMYARTLGDTTDFSLYLGDACHLPFADACFDKVLLSEVLEHLEGDAAALGEAWRVLRRQGILVVTVPYRRYPFTYDPINWLGETVFGRTIRRGPLSGAWMGHHRLYSVSRIERLLTQARFAIEESQMLTPWCFPFTHNLVYGFGKGTLLQRSLPEWLLREVDRFHPEAGRREWWNPAGWVMRLIDSLDGLNRWSAGRRRFVNIALKARKP